MNRNPMKKVNGPDIVPFSEKMVPFSEETALRAEADSAV